MSIRSSRPFRRVLAFVFAVLAAASGAPSTASGQVLAAEWHGAPSADGAMGTGIFRAGDVDADGVDDLLVGDVYYDTGLTLNVGRVSIYSGATFAHLRDHVGTHDSELFGHSGDTVGDLDLDGHDDYVIGARYHDTSVDSAGGVWVYSGQSGNLIWSAFGSAPFDLYGSSVAGLQDMDGDGRCEVLVGIPGPGDVEILDSNGASYLTFHGGLALGTAAARVSDLNGDGHDEFLVSRPEAYTPKVPNRGDVGVYSGLDATKLFAFLGDGKDDQLGVTCVGEVGDLDGDGVHELFAGAPASNTAGVTAGYVRIVSGADGTTIHTAYGDEAGDFMGYSMTRLADLDDDGFEEYAAGAPVGGLNDLGIVRVFSGRFGSTLFDYTSGSNAVGANYRFGAGVLAYQADGDGIVDLAITDFGWFDYALGNFVGGVWVYRGCPASWESYGAGWPGKNGVPSLVALDDPGLGDTIDVQLGNSLGTSTVALLFLGFADASVPTNAGGTLLVAPTFTIPLPLPAAGITLSDTLPGDPALGFLELFLQAIEADPFASKGLSFTPGLELTLGFDY